MLKRSEAIFCLLDQQTFECHWDTLVALARYKPAGYKIELFYFLTNHWFARAAKNVRRRIILDRWWGRSDWEPLLSMKGDVRRDVVARRFREELGYQSVKPWPIWSRRRSGGVVMYYMIHATDHPAAPDVMRRAYSEAVRPRRPEQLRIEPMG